MSPNSLLRKFLGKKKNISLSELRKHPQPETLIGETPDKGKRFLKRLQKDVDDDVAAVVFEVAASTDDVVPKKAKRHFVSDDPIADRAKVSVYMAGILKSVQSCEAPEQVQAAAAAAYKRAQQRDLAGQDEGPYILLDDTPRVRMVVGRVLTHPQRDKDKPPDPIDSDSMIMNLDHRGHLFAANLAKDAAFADIFINIIAEHGRVNTGAKKRFENAMAGYIQANPGETVHTIHTPFYRVGETRPFEISHYAVINGKVVGSVRLPNPTT